MHEVFDDLIQDQARLTVERAELLCAQTGLSAAAFCDELSLRVAKRYYDRSLSFLSADDLMNALWVVAAHHWNQMPDFFLNVFLAFESGEFSEPNDPPDSSPELLHTRPRIAEILASCGAGPRA